MKTIDNLFAQTEAAERGESPIFKEHFVNVMNHINDNKDEYIKKLPVLLTAFANAQVQLMMENNRQLIGLMQSLIKENSK